MDSPGRYCPTPGSMSSHPPPSASPQAIGIMQHQQQGEGQQQQQQQHAHHGHQQHQGYYGHGHNQHSYPMQQHSGYYQHQTVAQPVPGYYSPLQQQPQQQQQNNHVPITTASAPPPVTHNPYHPQSQQGAPSDWQQSVQQHYYHPQQQQQQQPHLQQQQQQPHSHNPQSVYPPPSHSPYGYHQQTPQQQQIQQGHVPPPQTTVHDNHMQQPQGQHALMNLSRFVSQSPSPSPSPGSSSHGPLLNGNNLNVNPDSQSPTRSLTSPSSSCSANGQMIPVRLQNMGKGQARTKANMRKLAMLEQQNSCNTSTAPMANSSETPPKKASRAKTPKNKKMVENGGNTSVDIKSPEISFTEGDSVLNGTNTTPPEKKRRGRKPNNSISPEEVPVTKKKRQSKKSLLNQSQDTIPVNGDTKPVKPPRKPRKKKEVLPVPLNPAEIMTTSVQEISMVHVEQPKTKTTGRRKKKSENLVNEPIPYISSPEKEYTLQIPELPEVNDMPHNTVKIVQTIKIPKPERKGKSEAANALQERKAILEEEVAQVLLDLGKNGPPSPLKIVEAPTTMLEIYENTNAVHGVKVKKSLNVVDKKAIAPKVKVPRTNKRKSAADAADPPVQPKRKKSSEKAQSTLTGKRKKSIQPDVTVKEDSPVSTKKAKAAETKGRVSLRAEKKLPEASKSKVNRSPKKVPVTLLPESSPVNLQQDQAVVFSPGEFSKSGPAKKNKRSPRTSIDSLSATAVLASPVPDFTGAPTPTKSAAAVPSKTATPTQSKATTPIPAKATPPTSLKVTTPTQIKTKSFKVSLSPAKTPTITPVKATVPTKTRTPTPAKDTVSTSGKGTVPISTKSATPTSTPLKAVTPISTPMKAVTPTLEKTVTLSLTAGKVVSPNAAETITPNPVNSPITVTIPLKAVTPASAKKATAKARQAKVKAEKLSAKSKAPPVETTVPIPETPPSTRSPVKTRTTTPRSKSIPVPAPSPVKSTTPKGTKTVKPRSKTVKVKAATPRRTPSPAKASTSKAAKAGARPPSPVRVVTPAANITKDLTPLPSKISQPSTIKRRSSTASRTSNNAIIPESIPSISTIVPITSGPPTEPDPGVFVVNKKEKSIDPVILHPVVSSISEAASKVVIKRRSSTKGNSLDQDSAESVISNVSTVPFVEVKPVAVMTKTPIIKKSSKNSLSPRSITKIRQELSSGMDLELVKVETNSNNDSVKVRRPRRKIVEKIEKPEPYQLNPKQRKGPTVFVKSTPLGGASKDKPEKEKHVGPSLKVIGGKVKFFRGSDEEDDEIEAKLPREKVPVEFDESLPWICVFCQLPPQVERLGDLYGPYYVQQDESKGKIPGKRETWMHEECSVWAHRVLLIGTTLRGLDEAVYFADREKCSVCGLIGATVGCLKRGCTNAVHVPCGKLKSWKLDLSTMQSYCPDHII